MGANAFDVLKERGFVQQVTNEEAVRQLFAEGPVTVYVGYDPTANSLHVGHLFTVMALLHVQRCGHRPIALVGGGTARVGDPSGKTEMRPMLEAQHIDANVAALRAQLETLFGRSQGTAALANNADWLMSLHYIDFLRDIGRHFSVNKMLSAETYKIRLEKGLSFIEFNYQILQAYDFLQLYRKHGCTLQMGGDDQWGNILAGVDLVRRLEHVQVHGMTFPLLLTATGAKMGKTAAGAVWLDPHKLSVFDYYQYFINTHDADVVKMLGFFTFLPMDEIRAVEALSGADLNIVKSILAFEATSIVHGIEEALKAHKAAQAAFGGRRIEAALLPSSAVPREILESQADIPSLELSLDAVSAGTLSWLEVLVRAGLAASKNEARRLITQSAVKWRDDVLSDPHACVSAQDFQEETGLLRVGKKKVCRLTVTG